MNRSKRSLLVAAIGLMWMGPGCASARPQGLDSSPTPPPNPYASYKSDAAVANAQGGGGQAGQARQGDQPTAPAEFRNAPEGSPQVPEYEAAQAVTLSQQVQASATEDNPYLIGYEEFSSGDRVEVVTYVHTYPDAIESYPRVSWSGRSYYNVQGTLVFWNPYYAGWCYYWGPPAPLIAVWNYNYPWIAYGWGLGYYGNGWYWGGVGYYGWHGYGRAPAGYRPTRPGNVAMGGPSNGRPNTGGRPNVPDAGGSFPAVNPSTPSTPRDPSTSLGTVPNSGLPGAPGGTNTATQSGRPAAPDPSGQFAGVTGSGSRPQPVPATTFGSAQPNARPGTNPGAQPGRPRAPSVPTWSPDAGYSARPSNSGSGSGSGPGSRQTTPSYRPSGTSRSPSSRPANRSPSRSGGSNSWSPSRSSGGSSRSPSRSSGGTSRSPSRSSGGSRSRSPSRSSGPSRSRGASPSRSSGGSRSRGSSPSRSSGGSRSRPRNKK